MLKVTFAGLRANKSRLVAVSLAVTLAVAFMSATLLLSSTTQATLKASLGAEMQHADIVVNSHDETDEWLPLSEDQLEQVRALPEVAAADGVRYVGVALKSDTREVPYATIISDLPEALDSTEIAEGRAAKEIGEIVIDADNLKLLGLKLGDTVTVSVRNETVVDEDGYSGSVTEITKTVVGSSKASANPFGAGSASVNISRDAFTEIIGIAGMPNLEYNQFFVKLAQGFSIADFKKALSTIEFKNYEGAISGTPITQTPNEIVAEQVESMTDGTDILTSVLLAFVAIALFVAGLVISNTFSVIVAQRARELAMLRCVGASARQVSNSVIIEAVVMSLVASMIGVLLAVGIMSGLVLFASTVGLAGSVGVFSMSWHAVVWPIVAGVVVTIIAASGPAREATRVAPIEALRSVQSETQSKNAGLVRLIVGIIFLIIGFAVIAVAQFQDDPTVSLVFALLGSIISAVGVLMLAVFVIPSVTYKLGKLLFSKSVPGKLAALNSIRNPKRTAATASALLIGVTLVSTVYTGAEVARATLSNELSSAFPIDISAIKMTEDVAISDTEVAELKLLDESIVDVVLAKQGFLESNENEIEMVWGVDPTDLALVTNDKDVVLEEGKALLGTQLDQSETSVTLTGDIGSLTLEASKEGAPRYTAIVTMQDFDQIATSSAGTQVALIKVVDSLSASEMLELREDIASIISNSYVSGEGIERAMFEDVIAILLLIVTALLAVAVIIAVIGIGNTLSLSVIERTRENALLRALGLTRSGLRGMLAFEALLTALTAAIIGVVLGLGYGFIGARSILQDMEKITFDVPWPAIGVILVAALLAGLLASVLPARHAVKVTPVEGLRAA